MVVTSEAVCGHGRLLKGIVRWRKNGANCDEDEQMMSRTGQTEQ